VMHCSAGDGCGHRVVVGGMWRPPPPALVGGMGMLMMEEDADTGDDALTTQ